MLVPVVEPEAVAEIGAAPLAHVDQHAVQALDQFLLHVNLFRRLMKRIADYVRHFGKIVPDRVLPSLAVPGFQCFDGDPVGQRFHVLPLLADEIDHRVTNRRFRIGQEVRPALRIVLRYGLPHSDPPFLKQVVIGQPDFPGPDTEQTEHGPDGHDDETICLLSKLEDRPHIEVKLNMSELDLTKAEKKATYQEIKDYVMEHTGLKVSSLYIAQVKEKCGIIERENYNKPKSEDAKQPQCPPDKEKAIKKALKYFGMI